MTWRLPKGEAVDGFVPAADEVVELVVSVDGESADSDCPVEVWAVAYPPDRIIANWRSVGTTIAETTGIEGGAAIAAEWMVENDGG
jgi:hypothetical protein